jgi:hypothetical protein
MATRKKASKATKKSIKKVTKKRATRMKARTLSQEERQRVVKPRDGWEAVFDRALDAWKAAPALKVPGLTLTKLARMGEKAEKAADQERALIAKQDRELRPRADARLLAQGAVWKSLLELNAAVKYQARQDPTLLEQFSFLTDILKNERAADEPRED